MEGEVYVKIMKGKNSTIDFMTVPTDKSQNWVAYDGKG